MRWTWTSSTSGALFPPELWTVYFRTQVNELRTTNKLEGWHQHFGQFVGKSNPNVYEFITRLKEEQTHREFRITSIAGVNHSNLIHY